MTTPTPPTGTITVQTSDVRHTPDPRDRMMHALAAVEDVLSALQGGTPGHIRISTERGGTCHVVMTCSGELVREFAARFHVEPCLVSCLFGEGSHWLEANAIVRGVTVKCGTLASDETAGVTGPAGTGGA
ncbi:hypothetical protein ACFQ60_22565 [Streptomyces zhihengii]|uniref:Uncharacterized protein n=1 Tax=Streptomyces zhihengii TaxID=1818004 RepID=A0ABS2UTV3_9ACTN|nr:hypothetical protein [Streptomyces zhihengii]MBM9620992.1 hypothetical protein [Streptomyces zhihengii]